MKFEVGQKLWYVPRHGKPHSIEIKSVGRKWLHTTRYRQRVDIKTLEVDGGDCTSPGQCYLARETYEAECALRTAWGDMRAAFYHQISAPKGVTVERIAQARELLGVQPQPKKEAPCQS